MRLIPFQFEQQEVRTVMVDGEPYFVARDVALILGYANTSKAINTHCKAVRTCPTEMGGQVRHVQVIPERDVYRLVMRSKLQAAERFEEWVSGEVLPTIRRTGGYQMPVAPAPEQPTPLPNPAAKMSVDVCLLQAYAGMFKIAESSKLALLKRIGKNHGADTSFLPGYVVDAPSGSLTYSSEPTAPVTEMLKKRGITMGAHAFNEFLKAAGYLEQNTRKTRSPRYAANGGIKSFWTITRAGLAFGKNIVSAESPRETQPHWYESKFDELLVLMREFRRRNVDVSPLALGSYGEKER